MGKNETTTSAKAKKIGRPTTCEAFTIAAIRSSSSNCRPCLLSSLCMALCAFSIMTMEASTMAPMAMAMPPKDIIFEPIPNSFISKKVSPMVSGSTIKTISDERKCMRKRPMMMTTIILSSMSVPLSVSTALEMSSERSYVVTTSTPSTFSSAILALMRVSAE